MCFSDFKLDYRDFYAMAIEASEKKNYESAYAFMKTANNLQKSSKTENLLKQLKSAKKKNSKTKKEEVDKRMKDFRDLCRGKETLRNATLDQNCTCKFHHFNDPYLKLGPFQMEILNLKPFIVTFPKFLSDSEVQEFIEEGSKNLHLSQIGKTDPGSDRSAYRTSKV